MRWTDPAEEWPEWVGVGSLYDPPPDRTAERFPEWSDEHWAPRRAPGHAGITTVYYPDPAALTEAAQREMPSGGGLCKGG